MWRRVKLPLILIVLLAGAAWLLYESSQKRAWLEFRSQRFWQSLAQVRLSYLGCGIFLIYCSYLFRSLRWREFLKPMKAARLGNIFTSTLIGFSAVALLGRPGELVRPFLIARKEQVPFSSQLAIWTLERIFDALTVGVLMGLTFALFPPLRDSPAAGARSMAHMQTAEIMLGAGALVMVLLLSQFRRISNLLMSALLWFPRLVPQRYRGWAHSILKSSMESFTSGLASIGTIRQLGACAAFSLLVWIPVILAYGVTTRGFGSPMSSLNLGAVVLLMAVTVLGSLAQVPGVGGGPQVATILVLTQWFGIPLEIASTAAILLWAMCFMAVLIAGLPLAAREGLTWPRLRSIAQGGAVNRPGDASLTPDSQ